MKLSNHSYLRDWWTNYSTFHQWKTRELRDISKWRQDYSHVMTRLYRSQTKEMDDIYLIQVPQREIPIRPYSRIHVIHYCSNKRDH